MVNTCATCKHWDPPVASYVSAGMCGLIVEEVDEIDESKNPPACLSVPEYGILMCRPDFGCTLWQARDGVLGNMMTDGRSSWPKESE